MEDFYKLSQSIVNSDTFTAKHCGIWDEFFSEPQEEGRELDQVIHQRLSKFLRSAFRRPVTSELVARYTKNVQYRIAKGESATWRTCRATGARAAPAGRTASAAGPPAPPTAATRLSPSVVLCSPRFLYLYDRPIKGVDDDFNLASRLSFFLWGSIPDEELLRLAESKTLSHKEVLTAQLKRMLGDKRLKRFCDSFPSQWLQLERIITSTPDRIMFPTFYANAYRTSMHMMLEPLLLFETILVENRPVYELIDSNFSYRSGPLSNWYKNGKRTGGLPPTRLAYKREILTSRREGGIITNAAVMTMTSNPTRSQPITRGAWMLTVIFNNPPEPPPADVPSLPEIIKGKHDETLTLRERLVAHRNRPDCAGCHLKIDPLGFALENYGPVGAWRDSYENGP